MNVLYSWGPVGYCLGVHGGRCRLNMKLLRPREVWLLCTRLLFGGPRVAINVGLSAVILATGKVGAFTCLLPATGGAPPAGDSGHASSSFICPKRFTFMLPRQFCYYSDGIDREHSGSQGLLGAECQWGLGTSTKVPRPTCVLQGVSI